MRYAIYFAAAAEDPLMQLGNAWLGRDPFTGTDLQQPTMAGLGAAEFRNLTGNPRRYGFHGTLKAPFSLCNGTTEAKFLEACEQFAGTIAPYEIKGLKVNRLGRFLALTPDQPETQLSSFASLCVRQFEDFRAPLSAEDRERRRQAGLTPRQDRYVADWGYPYVFDEFRFHMTLSNKLEDETKAQVLKHTAEEHFKEVTGQTRLCRHFAVYAESNRGEPFEIVKLFELRGALSPLEAQDRTDLMSRKENA